MPEQNNQNLIGEVTHYYSKIGVAIVKFFKTVPVGTRIKFHGSTTDFEQVISSMQKDYKEVSEAKKGDEVGIKVDSKVREGDKVFEIN